MASPMLIIFRKGSSFLVLAQDSGISYILIGVNLIKRDKLPLAVLGIEEDNADTYSLVLKLPPIVIVSYHCISSVTFPFHNCLLI